MSGSLGLSKSGSQQQSQSQSGLRGGYAEQISPHLAGVATDASSLSRNFAQTPFGFFMGKKISGPDQDSHIQTDAMGLPIEVQNAMTGIANQYFSKASAGGAMRGQTTPENTQGIVGSALQNMGSFLLPYILQTKQYLTELPDKLMSNRLGFLQNTMASSAPLLGSQSSYTGSSDAFGFNVGGGIGYGGGGSKGP